ncbi:hypothetical protein QOT17_010950 [Balamuthia mandrillaris]
MPSWKQVVLLLLAVQAFVVFHWRAPFLMQPRSSGSNNGMFSPASERNQNVDSESGDDNEHNSDSHEFTVNDESSSDGGENGPNQQSALVRQPPSIFYTCEQKHTRHKQWRNHYFVPYKRSDMSRIQSPDDLVLLPAERARRAFMRSPIPEHVLPEFIRSGARVAVVRECNLPKAGVNNAGATTAEGLAKALAKVLPRKQVLSAYNDEKSEAVCVKEDNFYFVGEPDQEELVGVPPGRTVAEFAILQMFSGREVIAARHSKETPFVFNFIHFDTTCGLDDYLPEEANVGILCPRAWFDLSERAHEGRQRIIHFLPWGADAEIFSFYPSLSSKEPQFFPTSASLSSSSKVAHRQNTTKHPTPLIVIEAVVNKDFHMEEYYLRPYARFLRSLQHLRELLNLTIVVLGGRELLAPAAKRFADVHYPDKIPFVEYVQLLKRSWMWASAIVSGYELSIIESQMCGNFILSIDAAVWRAHYLMGVTGWEVTAEDLERVEQVVRWIVERYDPEVPRRFALEYFGWERIAMKLLERLHPLLQELSSQ